MKSIRPRELRAQPWRRLPAAAGVALAFTLFFVAAPYGQSQQPTFRASVDLIAVDVQVVDSNGRPITTMGPNGFDVTIDGKKRRVVSADLIEAAVTAAPNRPLGSGPTASNLWPAPEGRGRTYVLAIDTGSFTPGEILPVVRAARGFVDRLDPSDQVGMFTLPPFASAVDPTTDRAVLRHALDGVAGHRQSLAGQFNLSPSEIIDITAETAGLGSPAMANPEPPVGVRAGIAAPPAASPLPETLQRVRNRECRSVNDLGCVEAIVSEASSLAQYLEERVIQSLNGIGALLDLLGQIPGRKTVVVLSEGMAVSDRPGGRIEIGNEGKQLGERAARANATIYAIHVDPSVFGGVGADARRPRESGSLARERRMSSKVLDEFAAASGGALLPVMVGGGDIALDRVLAETSAFYVLGVEPAASDRDGRVHRLQVKVGERGATVRSRQWVVVSARPGSSF
jgi:VWFA-related protein